MSPAIDALATALALAQSSMEGARKDSENPYFKSRYADLQSVWVACRGPLSANGLSVVQSPGTTWTDHGPCVSVDTLLLHTSGQWVRSSVSVTAKDDSPQAVGSCISYLRRYALAAIVGVASVDDDGQAAHTVAPVKTITGPQQKKLFTIAEQSGWSHRQIRDYLISTVGVEHSKEIPVSRFDQLCADFDVPPDESESDPA